MVVCRLWHLCQPRYPRFVHFSWSFPVNWYIQSILYTLQSSQSHSYQLRSSTSLRNCTLLSPPSLSYLPVALSPHAKHLPTIHYPCFPPSPCPFLLPFSLRCYWLTTLSSEHTRPYTRRDLFTPTLLFVKCLPFFLSRSRENCVPPSSPFPLRLTSHDHSVSLLVACSMRLLSSHHPLNSSPPHHMVYCFSAVCELCFGLPFAALWC